MARRKLRCSQLFSILPSQKNLGSFGDICSASSDEPRMIAWPRTFFSLVQKYIEQVDALLLVLPFFRVDNIPNRFDKTGLSDGSDGFSYVLHCSLMRFSFCEQYGSIVFPSLLSLLAKRIPGCTRYTVVCLLRHYILRLLF